MFTSRDEYWMGQALAMAESAKQAGEVPVGAVLVLNDELLVQAYNSPITDCDPSAHAEMAVLRKGGQALGNYRLLNTTLYVTLEPCFMCAGAMVHARIKRLVYGASDLKAGAVQSMCQCLDYSFLNHRVEYVGGLMAAKCGNLLSDFFRERR
jgi:tRNA(adenine34) deaminase